MLLSSLGISLLSWAMVLPIFTQMDMKQPSCRPLADTNVPQFIREND